LKTEDCALNPSLGRLRFEFIASIQAEQVRDQEESGIRNPEALGSSESPRGIWNLELGIQKALGIFVRGARRQERCRRTDRSIEDDEDDELEKRNWRGSPVSSTQSPVSPLTCRRQ